MTTLSATAPSDPAAPTADPAAFKSGMRRLASGVSIVAVVIEGARHGLAVTSVTSLAVDPPSLLVCVSRTSSAYRPLVEAGRFGVSVLAADQLSVSLPFGDPSRREERFRGETWHEDGTAIVLADALSAFVCRTERIVDHASHAIFIASVEQVRLREGGGDPLVHVERGYRGTVPLALPDGQRGVA
ncbi:flavin reductase family protein [Segnochrobactrum spirostomi]|uniref:Flavin reductase n=1 Tax=Segnochrobactrum spirostomi TaxID=2608987 RepID=A0A6A7YDH4_9HYPH|nr:flavin reductase family protein [Segnochrobactrum spirostomi]MQT15479.1 flavin reductase [Segnochrobactrum spirostomi]